MPVTRMNRWVWRLELAMIGWDFGRRLDLLLENEEDDDTTLSAQLRSALRWWLRVFPTSATPREIPKHLRQRLVFPPGVGVAVWGTMLKSPMAAFPTVFREVRMLWSSQHELFGASFQDIHEIEAVGPLVILATWPGFLAGILWIHFIDNAAAQASLVSGSSSITLLAK